jgi:hypothetical protein
MLADDPGAAIKDGISSIAAAGQDAARQAEQAEKLVQQQVDQAKQLQQEAEAALADAQAKLTQLEANLATQTAALQAAIAKATTDGQAAVESAKRKADQLRAAGQAAALEAEGLAADVEQQAQQVVTDAQAAADKAVADAQATLEKVEQDIAAARQQLEDKVAELTAKATQLAADVQQLVADTANQIAARAQELANDAQQLAADAAALPDRATALAEDARHQLDSLVEQNASLIGLLTHGLIYLKEHYFAAENRLQVVTFAPAADAKPGIGLTWVDGANKLLLAYDPERPGPRGSIVVQASGGDGSPIVIPAAPPVHVTITGAGAQETVISLDSGASPNGDADVTIALSLATSSLSWQTSLGHAAAGTPTVEVRVHTKDGSWHYRASGKLTGVEWSLRLGAVLGPIGDIVPIPEFGETRTFGVSLEDGVFDYTEEVAS